MIKGKPTKWAWAEIWEPIWLGKAGIKIVVWDKRGKKRRGALEVRVGGIRWYPYKAKRAKTIKWNKLSKILGM